ncbi:MAG: redoxin domain-containing protein [Candidatus Dormibacteraeota bacterium]|uniref:Redoxin domain-containing protein n=2 Tax=Candidatus Aeolococcus gillhamiae TaxID=3127015 RepID=A0A934NAG0_9BACT|nr:redoxin domain-containing protein [Candidatus Dormibacteraeota bacterium]
MTNIISELSSARPVAPGSEAPTLECELLDGSHFRLADRCPEDFTMIVFYRGNHCPVCRVQLRDLDRRLDDFAPRAWTSSRSAAMTGSAPSGAIRSGPSTV